MAPLKAKSPVSAARVIAAALCCLAPAGCADNLGVSRHFYVELDHPGSIIEKALASCASRSAAAEAACVKQGLIGANVTVAALPGMLPGCRPGQECHLDYTTEDRIGFVATVASDYRVTWRVTVDLRKPAATIDAVPIQVEQLS